MSAVVRASVRQIAQIWRQGKIPPTIIDILRKTSPPNVDTIILVVLDMLRTHAIALTDYIDIVLREIDRRAREQGMVVTAGSRSCHSSRCFTCLGKYDAHYPEVIVRLPDGSRKTIRSRELIRFLEGLKFDEEEIRSFLTAIDARIGLIKLSNYFALFYTKLGVVEVRTT